MTLPLMMAMMEETATDSGCPAYIVEHCFKVDKNEVATRYRESRFDDPRGLFTWRLEVGPSFDDSLFISVFLVLESAHPSITELTTNLQFSFETSQRELNSTFFGFTPPYEVKPFSPNNSFVIFNLSTGTDSILSCRFTSVNKRNGISKWRNVNHSFIIASQVMVFCKIEIPGVEWSKVMDLLVPPPAWTPLNGGDLFKSGRYSDITLVVGKTEFKGHRLILGSHSSYFATMFHHEEMRENREQRVEIEDFEPDTIRQMLEYIYQGTLPNGDAALQLLQAADKVACQRQLITEININNVLDIFVVASLCNASKLKSHTLRVIQTNLHQLVIQKEWLEMAVKQPDMLADLYKGLETLKTSILL